MKNNTLLFDRFGILQIDHKTANIFIVFIGSLSIGILAQLSISLPFSPIPITGQTVGVVLVGGFLGARRGALSIFFYLLEGAVGLPVFAQMKAGAQVLIGPTAGYLWGFVIAAFLIGYLAERGFTNSLVNCYMSCFLATTIILITGTLYLSIFKGLNNALHIGFYPFIIGDIIKSGICAGLLASIRKINHI